jgi:deoxyribonuclease-4
MRIGAHVDSADPIATAIARGAEVAQFFLTDPQSYAAPVPRPDAEALLAAKVDIYIHSPYRINVATTNNRIRIPSRKLLQQHAVAAAQIGAKGLIVHGGHVDKGADMEVGFANWRKTFAYAAKDGGFPLPILIENTAGGDNACARRFDANDSRDPFDSGADRHDNLGHGVIHPDVIVAVLRAAGAPAVVETPAGGQAADIALLRAGLHA